MKIINNFSTLKKDKKFDKMDLLFWKTSCFKYKDSGYDLKLYCKSENIEFLKENDIYNIYDEIDTDFLDNFTEPLDIDETVFWSHRKLRCIEHEFSINEKPFIYSDTDVICEKPLKIKEDADAMFWQLENPSNNEVLDFSITYIPWKCLSKPVNYKMPNYYAKIKSAYNCGIMYFKSKEVFLGYLKQYLDFVAGNPGKIYNSCASTAVFASNAEQRILYAYLKHTKANVQLILNGRNRNGLSKNYNHYFLYKALWKEFDKNSQKDVITNIYYYLYTKYMNYLNKRRLIYGNRH